MGRLSDMVSYLQDRSAVLADAERRLTSLQERYETHFAEVSKVREHELGQLGGHLIAGRAQLPPALARELDQTRRAVEQELAAKVAQLTAERDRHRAEAEALRQASRAAEVELRAANVDLDAREESLKAKIEQLQTALAEYNRRIRALGTGFGFFSGFFAMRRLAAEKGALEEKQQGLARAVEKLRAEWQARDVAHAAAEEERRKGWIEAHTRAAEKAAQLEAIESNRAGIVDRSTLERVLYARAPRPVAPGRDDPACPRCKSPNARASRFCRVCAQRLGPDDPGLEGSLLEIAELNAHHAQLQAGVKSCQELLGLIRGVRSGIAAFEQSVQTMIANEKKYPLPKLSIEVPEASRRIGGRFEEIGAAIGDGKGVHPRDLGTRVKGVAEEILTEANVKDFFERMGGALSTSAKAQWG